MILILVFSVFAVSKRENLSELNNSLSNILNIDTLRGVLHKKGQDEAIRYGRPETSLTEGMYPKQGYARFQPKGLATNHNKPMDGPIMPIAGFYDPDMPNVLGGLPGK